MIELDKLRREVLEGCQWACGRRRVSLPSRIQSAMHSFILSLIHPPIHSFIHSIIDRYFLHPFTPPLLID